MSMPASAPIAKAASVQAANATPRRSDRETLNWDASESERDGLAVAEVGLVIPRDQKAESSGSDRHDDS